jgi:hypothetical protein
MLGLRVALVVRGRCGPTLITWWRTIEALRRAVPGGECVDDVSRGGLINRRICQSAHLDTST